MEMNSSQLIEATIGFLTMAGGLVGVYVTHEKKLALAKQENVHTQNQVNKLEKRVGELEDRIFQKLDKMNESIEEIKIQIAKLQ